MGEKEQDKEKRYPGEREKINCCEVMRDFDDGSHYFLCNEQLDELGCCYNGGELGSCPDNFEGKDRCGNKEAQMDCLERLLIFCNENMGQILCGRKTS